MIMIILLAEKHELSVDELRFNSIFETEDLFKSHWQRFLGENFVRAAPKTLIGLKRKLREIFKKKMSEEI